MPSVDADLAASQIACSCCWLLMLCSHRIRVGGLVRREWRAYRASMLISWMNRQKGTTNRDLQGSPSLLLLRPPNAVAASAARCVIISSGSPFIYTSARYRGPVHIVNTTRKEERQLMICECKCCREQRQSTATMRKSGASRQWRQQRRPDSSRLRSTFISILLFILVVSLFSNDRAKWSKLDRN